MFDRTTTHQPAAYRAHDGTTRRTRRTGSIVACLIVLGVSALVLGSAGIASAAQPIRFVFPQPTFTSDCGTFPILIELEGSEKRTVFLDANGNVTRVLFTYPLGRVTVTNLDSETGKSISVSLSGPLHIDVTPDGNVYRLVGAWLFDFNPETGEAGWFLAKGQLSETEDSSGVVTDRSWHGHVEDVCAMLAE